MPSSAVPPPPSAKLTPSFQTLIREHSFKHPSTVEAEYPALQEAIQPHINSFNAITQDNLLEIALKDIGKKTVFDHKGNNNGGRGNKLMFWLEDVQLSRPTLTSRERTSLNRRLYPVEVNYPMFVTLTCRVERERPHTKGRSEPSLSINSMMVPNNTTCENSGRSQSWSRWVAATPALI